MTKQPAKTKTPKPTGKSFKSVQELMKATGASSKTEEQVKNLAQSCRLTKMLVKFRQDAGLTQEDMAERLGCTQGRVSKLESKLDADLTFVEFHAYLRQTKNNLLVKFGSPINHVQSVKMHAMEIRKHLHELARLAHKGKDLEESIQGFFGEAFFNLLSILSECHDALPVSENDDQDVRVFDPTAPIEKHGSFPDENELLMSK